MQKAIFLDRDGVLNRELGRYTTHLEEMEILDHAKIACAELKALGYVLIVVTNQGGIAKGLYSKDDLKKIHEKLKREIPEIDAIYYCPHHSEFGKCLCRKPDSLMLEKAISKFDIDTSVSWIIGDSERDIEAGNKVGVQGIKIESNAPWSALLFV